MKTFFFSTIILGIFISLYSCSEVIELDIVNAEPQIVIEGSVGNNGDTTEIKISKSVGLYADNTFPVVSNATVILSDNLGNRDTLIETTAGTNNSTDVHAHIESSGKAICRI